jgi:hypothetical protein
MRRCWSKISTISANGSTRVVTGHSHRARIVDQQTRLFHCTCCKQRETVSGNADISPLRGQVQAQREKVTITCAKIKSL